MNTQYRHCGRKLTPSELVEFLTDQHCAMVDDPIMLWLSMSLEDVADVVQKAINNSESADFDSMVLFAGNQQALAAARKFGADWDAFDNWRQS